MSSFLLDNVMIRYKDLSSDEDRAIFAAAKKFYDIIKNALSDSKIYVFAFEMNRLYYNTVKLAVKTEVPSVLKEFICKYSNKNVLLKDIFIALADNLSETVNSGFNLMRFGARSAAVNGSLDDEFEILDIGLYHMSDAMISEYVSTLSVLSSLSIQLITYVLDEYDVLLNKAVRKLNDSVMLNDKPNYRIKLNLVLWEFVALNIDVRKFIDFYNSICGCVEIPPDLYDLVIAKVALISNSLSVFFREIGYKGFDCSGIECINY